MTILILMIKTPFKKSQHYPDLFVCTVVAQCFPFVVAQNYDFIVHFKKCEQTRADQNIN